LKEDGMIDKKIILHPKESFEIWSYNNLKLLQPNLYGSSFSNSYFSLEHKSYTTGNLYHISIQSFFSQNSDVIDYRSFNLPYINFVYILEGEIRADYFKSDKQLYRKDSWILSNSSFNEKSSLIYIKNSNMKFLHITLLEPILRYYMEFDTPFSSLIESELARSSKKIVYLEGGFNSTIKDIIYTIINNIGKSAIGDKIIQIKIDELFLIVLPFLISSQTSDIDKIDDFVKVNYNQKLTLKNLSKLFKVSEYYIRENFKNTKNISFNEYIKMIRLQKAYELISINPKISFNTLAYSVGYTNSTRLKLDLIEYEKRKGKVVYFNSFI
jgi:AraC-like DNA-binding protein